MTPLSLNWLITGNVGIMIILGMDTDVLSHSLLHEYSFSIFSSGKLEHVRLNGLATSFSF